MNSQNRSSIRLLAAITLLVIFASCPMESDSDTDSDALQAPGDWLRLTIDGEAINLNQTYSVGAVNIGEESTTSFVITNVGQGPVNLAGGSAAITVGGSNAAQFTASLGQGSTTLNRNESIQLNLVYAPAGSTVGPRSATLSIRAAEDSTPYTLDLAGSANGAILRATIQDGGDEIELSPGSLIDFGTVNNPANGGAQRLMTVSIHNEGNAPLIFAAIELTGEDAEDTNEPVSDSSFHWSALPGTEALEPETTRDIIIRIVSRSSPGEPVIPTGRLEISSNAVGEGMDSVLFDLTAELVY